MPEDTEVGKRQRAIASEAETAMVDGVSEADIREAVENDDKAKLAAYEMLGILG